MECDNKRSCTCTFDCLSTANAVPVLLITATTTRGCCPAAFFSKEAEANYDRSMEALMYGY